MNQITSKNMILFVILLMSLVVAYFFVLKSVKENYNDRFDNLNYKTLGDFNCDCEVDNKLRIAITEGEEDDEKKTYDHHYDRYKRRYNFLGSQNKE